jgi:hypothetical protein
MMVKVEPGEMDYPQMVDLHHLMLVNYHLQRMILIHPMKI